MIISYKEKHIFCLKLSKLKYKYWHVISIFHFGIKYITYILKFLGPIIMVLFSNQELYFDNLVFKRNQFLKHPYYVIVIYIKTNFKLL